MSEKLAGVLDLLGPVGLKVCVREVQGKLYHLERGFVDWEIEPDGHFMVPQAMVLHDVVIKWHGAVLATVALPRQITRLAVGDRVQLDADELADLIYSLIDQGALKHVAE